MERKKFIAQVAIAVVLYVLISLILEKEYSSGIIFREVRDGLVFGLVYALFLWIWHRVKSGKKSQDE